MIATNWRPSDRSDQKCLEQRQRLDRPARLRRDEEQGLVEVDPVADRADRAGVGRVEHVQRGPAVLVAEAQADHLGRERRAAHPEEDDVLEALVADLAREGLEVVDGLAHRVADRQPAEPVGDLGLPGRAPERVVLLPDAVRDVLDHRLAHALGDPRLEVLGDVGLDRRRARGDDRLALLVDALEQLVHRLDELRDAVAQELGGDVVEVDAGGSASALEVRGRVLISPSRPLTFAWSAAASSVAIGIVFTVSGRDQPVDVHRVRVLRVLHAGRRPQRPLDGGAGLAAASRTARRGRSP